MDAGRRGLLLAAVVALGAAAAGGVRAQPAELAASLPGARLQGSGRLRFFGLHVYDARLWTAGAAAGPDWAAAPLALELEYARSLKGVLIAERSLKEMRRQGDIADADATRWLAAMTDCFPDVQAGDRLTGLLQPGRGARFFLNGAPRCEMAEPAFARLFFGIWLAPQTSEPALRQALLGGAR